MSEVIRRTARGAIPARLRTWLRRAAHPSTERGANITVRSLNEFIDHAELVPISLVDYRYQFGDMPLHELIVLCRLIRLQRPRSIFEIGTYNGGTTMQLAVNSSAAVHTLDLPPPGHPLYAPPVARDPSSDVYPELPGERFRESPCASRITQCFGDSRTFDFSPFTGSIDIVLVDACHHYEYVVNDSAKALQIVSPGGMVVWHDYAPYAPGVQQALHEFGRTRRLVQLSGTTLVVFRNAPVEESPHGHKP